MKSRDQEHQDQANTIRQVSQTSPTGNTRRRLISAVGGGVLLSVKANTALGSKICQSPSVMMSGNTSPRPDNGNCTGGRSPGFWAQPQHFLHWREAGGIPPMFKHKVVDCTTGLGKLGLADITDTGTSINAVFPGAVPQDYGMWAVIAFPKEESFGENRQLLRHLSAAWLNAGYFDYYPMTQTQVKNMWLDLRYGGLYCPTGNCNGGGWTAAQVIAYIEGMYDFNADVPNLCKLEN